ncbi:MAG TPA: sodium:calcium antiporter [Chloroflexota bacterium]|nr:sodium:calcium antiporter [Chloroflexota bacterium]
MGSPAGLLPLLGAALLPAPWIAVWATGSDSNPELTSALTGLAILGAAFLLSWAAELLQLEVSQALALALLALIAVLPEYAVDAVFAFQAGRDPAVAQHGYAIANMTGANRLLIGVGWSSVVLLAWLRHGRRRVLLERSQALEMGILLAATVYALTIPFKGDLSLLDTAVLLGLFALYTWVTARLPSADPHLTGPAERVGALGRGPRRLVTVGLLLYAALAIFLAAEPFAHGLVETGQALGVDEFLLVQWLAPLASEAPEFVVALLFVWRGGAAAAMRTLVSSKVNQWTLLVATLPPVFGLGAGHLGGMPLVARQRDELWLTAAQSFFAIVLISKFELHRWEAVALLVPFLLQLGLPPGVGGINVHLAFTVGYVVVGALLLLDRRRRRAIRSWPACLRECVDAAPLSRATWEPLAPEVGPRSPGRRVGGDAA